MHLYVRNATHALSDVLATVLAHGVDRPSRNGPVTAMDEPVTVTYERPDERVIFSPEREANPFFHLYECLWMMNGQRDVSSVAVYVAGMRNFSDNGTIFNAAYGHRWRKHFGIDQLRWVVDQLRSEGGADTRRAHIAMWDPKRDTKPSLDLPCNLGVTFRVRSNGHLDMTVHNRSNDLVLGMTGANVVHMSFLHELVARASGFPLGRYHQMTNDLHLYKEAPSTAPVLSLSGAYDTAALPDPYSLGHCEPFPVMSETVDLDTWLVDNATFLRYGNVVGLRDPFFRRVAAPMLAAHKFYRQTLGAERYEGAIEILDQCLASDWRNAGREWMQRRLDKWKEKTR